MTQREEYDYRLNLWYLEIRDNNKDQIITLYSIMPFLKTVLILVTVQ